jgi:serine/threonine protein kinase
VQGTQFGRYLLVELLGRGGMGEVWRARDTATDRVVALKVLPPHLAHDEVFKERFRREAHAAARLNDPHVVPIHNYGEIGDRLYVDMRLIEGRDLQSVLGDGPLIPARAVMIIEQVAKALYAAHKVGLVHRDVKPSNILVADFDFAYLIDFGIARGVDETRLTNTGGMVGTWHYMAPERLSSGYADARSDIYALTCVLHECLTGDQPFPGDSLERQIAAHLMAPPPRPSIARRGVPAEFDRVIAKGMAKNPAERYPTTIDLANAARAASTVPIPRAPSVPPRPVSEPARFASAPIQRRGPAYPPSTPRQPQFAPPPVVPPRSRRNVGLVVGLVAAVILAVASVIGVMVMRSTSSTSTDAGSSAATAGDVLRSLSLGIEVWQNGKAVPLFRGDQDPPVITATIKSAPFELRFPTLAQGKALQICAWTDDSVFDIQRGGDVSANTCFRPGTGVADYAQGSGTLYLRNNDGHNYLAGNRVAHEDASQDKFYVSQIFRNKTQTPMADFTGTLYLAAYIDANGDKKFDATEYDYLKLNVGV